MPGITNFLQFDPPALNQENDVAYNADSTRAGGAPLNSIFPSQLANKLFYQLTTFLAAFAQMLTAKGYSPNDGSANPPTAVNNLAGILNDLITSPELIAALAPYTLLSEFGSAYGTTGYQRLPGGLLIEWITGASMSTVIDNQTQTLNFPLPFPTACFFALVSTYGASIDSDAYLQVTSFNNGSANVLVQKTVPALATPPGGGHITPVLLVIGH